MGDGPAMLRVENLSVSFAERGTDRRQLAVESVSLEAPAGQIVGIVGETGSGKSTVLKAIIGLLTGSAVIESGVIEFDGRDLLTLDPEARRRMRGTSIGYVPQNPFGSLNPVVRLDRQFRKVLQAHGLLSSSTVTWTERAVNALADVGIPDPERVLRSYAHQLSGGMAQRVALALVLQLSPRLLLADEPTTALDVTVQKQFLDLLALLPSANRSVLIVTHDLGIVAQYCSTVAVMNSGRIVEQGIVMDVLGRPSHSYTQSLVHASRRGDV